jgi:integrase
VLPTAGKLTVGDWLTKWLGHKKGEVAAGTYKFYEKHVARRLRPYLGEKKLADLGPVDVADWLAAMTADGHSADAQAKAVTTLRTCLKDAVAKGLVFVNVATRVKKPRVERAKVEPFDLDQARALLRAAHAGDKPLRLAALIDLSLDSGCRQGEALALHWPDIDWKAGTVRINKSLYDDRGTCSIKLPKSKKSIRTVALAPRTVAALAEHRERMRAEGQDVDVGPMFVNKAGGWVTKKALFKTTWTPLLKRAGLPHRKWHTMRHTNATLLLRAGGNIRLVSERLGHERIEITLGTYAAFLAADQGHAARLVAEMFGPPPENGPQMAPTG